MADSGAWDQGWSLGSGIAQQQQAHKQALSDEEFHQVNDELFKQRDAIQSKLPALKDDPTAYQNATDQLTTINKAIRLHWHPDKNPGMIQKYGHMLLNKIGISHEAQQPSVTTQSQGVAFGNGTTGPAGPNTTVKGPTPGQAKQYNQTTGRDKAETQRIEAAAPLSPSEQGAASGAQQTAQKFAQYRTELSDWLTSHQDAKDDEKKQASNDIWENTFNFVGSGTIKPVSGTLNGVPTNLLMDSKGRLYDIARHPIPEEQLSTWVPTGTAESNEQAGYAKFLKDNPDYEKNGGNIYKWKASSSAKPIKGGLIRVKPGQSPTGWVETRVDPYTSKVVGYVITTPSRYYQGTTTSRTTTDPAGVTSTSSATTTPTNTAETDLSKFPETDVSTFGNIPLMSDDGTPVPQRSSESTPNTPQGSSSVTPSGGEATTPQESTPKPTLKELKKEAEARKPQNVSTSEKLSDNPRGPQYLPVDENGYIPSTDNVNEQLREAANQLLDGVAMKDVTIPTRDKPAAESLARKYGWDQGAFLPREIIQLNNAEQFLDSALNSKKFMNALNEGVASSVKTSMATADPSKEGVFGRGVQAWASKGLNPNEQEYRRLSNNMLGTIAGLSSILRSGRATEGLINRLKLELPNVMTSSNSKDAKQQILNIKKEIDLALRKSSVRRVDKDTQSGSSDTTDQTVSPDDTVKRMMQHINDSGGKQ